MSARGDLPLAGPAVRFSSLQPSPTTLLHLLRLPQITQRYNLPSPGLASSVYDSLRPGGGASNSHTHGHANTTLLAGMSHPNLAGAAGILASYQTRQVAAAAGAPQHMCHVVHHGLRRPHPQHSPSSRAGPDRPPCNLSTSSVDVHTSSVELSRSRSISVELSRARRPPRPSCGQMRSRSRRAPGDRPT